MQGHDWRLPRQDVAGPDKMIRDEYEWPMLRRDDHDAHTYP